MIRITSALVMMITATAISLGFAEGSEGVVLRFIRAYGQDNERFPPVILLSPKSGSHMPGWEYATVEFDIQSSTIPNTYVKLVHCNADWTEDSNGFLNDAMNRSSLADWSVAPLRSTYYSYRGTVTIPNPQLQLRFAGNWKVVVYDMDSDVPLGETRIFVVDPQAQSEINFMTDFYEPSHKVSSIALTLEAIVRAGHSQVIDPNVHTTVFYRNHRWYEPFICSTKRFDTKYPYHVATHVVGVFPGGKAFRIGPLPAENEHRILDLTNLAQYPSTGQPVRMPLSDLPRNGMFIERSNDGALITTTVSQSDDEYVPVEILLDPSPGPPSTNDVFLAGSFNNWKPDKNWQMYYDEQFNLYRLRQWFRRGVHDYLYATGTLNIDTDEVSNCSFEEFEGNTASNSNSFVAFTYARMMDYGGYDAIVAATSSNIYQNR